MTTIIINATAARSSGALTILKDFMSYLYEQKKADCVFHLFTCTKSLFESTENIVVHELPPQNWRTRLAWDKNGLQKWCENNRIVPNLVISLQNTCPRFKGALRRMKLLVYYHQPLPLVKYQWKWLRRDERQLFLYAHFYRFFVNRWNKNAEYVVQLPSVKNLFCKRFQNIKSNRIHIIRPNLPEIDVGSVQKIDIDENKKLLLYPATPLRYKNHIVVLKALSKIREENPELFETLKVVFTVPSESEVALAVKEMNLDSVVSCIGSVPYEKLLSYYKSSCALLFPSKIESFGMPLIEAAFFGINIVASDLPYAKEVLENYKNKSFCNPDNADEWKNAIQKVALSKNELAPLEKQTKNSWEEFMKLAERMMTMGGGQL